MKKKFTLILLLLVITCSRILAQAVSLEIDNQTPGWLSSKIPYSDQLTVQNLKVTGYLNEDDLTFITNLNNKSLKGLLDLKNVTIISSTENKDNYLVAGKLKD